LIKGITTAVLKSANAPGRADGQQVGGQDDELVSEGAPGHEGGPVEYERYTPDGEAITHAEPAELSTDPLAAPVAAQPTDRDHDNVQAAYQTPGTGRGSGRDANGTRSR
jgi:hypothetical protein